MNDHGAVDVARFSPPWRGTLSCGVIRGPRQDLVAWMCVICDQGSHLKWVGRHWMKADWLGDGWLIEDGSVIRITSWFSMPGLQDNLPITVYPARRQESDHGQFLPTLLNDDASATP